MGTALWYLRRRVAIIVLVVVVVVVAVLLVTVQAGGPRLHSAGQAMLVPTSMSLLTHAEAPTDDASSKIGCALTPRRAQLSTSVTAPTAGSRASWPAVGA